MDFFRDPGRSPTPFTPSQFIKKESFNICTPYDNPQILFAPQKMPASFELFSFAATPKPVADKKKSPLRILTNFNNQVEDDSTSSSQSQTKKFFDTPTFEGQEVDLTKLFAAPVSDLNQTVNEILSKAKMDVTEFKSVIRHNSRAPKEKRRRLRKNKDQSKYLEREYQKNPNWGKVQISKLSRDLRLKESQIYKWNWDMRKKDGLTSEIE